MHQVQPPGNIGLPGMYHRYRLACCCAVLLNMMSQAIIAIPYSQIIVYPNITSCPCCLLGGHLGKNKITGKALQDFYLSCTYDECNSQAGKCNGFAQFKCPP